MAEYKVASINVTSLIAIDRRVELDRRMTNESFDFALVQETRLRDSMIWRTKGFKIYRNDSGVGTLIIAKNKFKCEIKDIANLKTTDCTCIEVKGKNQSKLFIISIYIKCSSNLNDIHSDLNLIATFCGRTTTIIGGDLNTSGLQKKHIESWVNLNAINFRLTSPSAPTFRTGSKLDHFIVSTDISSRRTCGILDMGHEHKLIHLKVTVGFAAIRGETIKVKKWYKTDWEKFQDCANNCLHTFVPEHRNVSNDELDELVNSLTEDINNAIDQGIPTGGQGFGALWDLPDSIDHWFRERRRLKRILSRAKGKWLADIDRIEHLKRAVREATKKINKTIAEERQRIVAGRIKNINDNDKNKFKVIRSFTQPKSNSQKSLLLKTEAGDKIFKEEDKAEVLSHFYGELYRSRIPNCAQLDEVWDDCETLRCVNRIIDFSDEESALRPAICPEKFLKFSEVGTFIKGIANKTSSGDDNIPNIVIRKLPISYIVALTKLFNHCINNCYFPRKWKTAIVCAIPKKVGYCTPSELRPISLTSNMGKLLEMGIMRNIQRELIEDTIPDYQFGFRPGHSTLDALHILNETLIEERRKRKVVAVCSLDVKKAFDSVWHCGMVHKMMRQGCEPSTSRIVQSFLTDRTARLRIGAINSKQFIVGRGVPQGSRLGPILFNIYVGDLKVITKDGGSVLQYADDTLLLHPSANAQYAVRKVEGYYSQVEEQFNNWGIFLNAGKTKLMIARPQEGRKRGQVYKKITAKMGGEEIIPSRDLKYLGVYFDTKGTFMKHAKEASLKGRKLLGACKRLLGNKGVNNKTQIQIYKMLVRSSIMYANPIWFQRNNRELMRKIERKAFRFILGDAYNFVTKKTVSNKKLYKATDCERITKFGRRVKERHKSRLTEHKNKMIINSLIN